MPIIQQMKCDKKCKGFSGFAKCKENMNKQQVQNYQGLVMSIIGRMLQLETACLELLELEL